MSVNGSIEQQAIAIYSLKEKQKNSQVLLLSNQLTSQEVLRMISSEVSGILDKTASLTKIKEPLQIIEQGGCVISPVIVSKVFNHLQPKSQFRQKLSKCEREVLEGMLSGQSYQAIAD